MADRRKVETIFHPQSLSEIYNETVENIKNSVDEAIVEGLLDETLAKGWIKELRTHTTLCEWIKYKNAQPLQENRPVNGMPNTGTQQNDGNATSTSKILQNQVIQLNGVAAPVPPAAAAARVPSAPVRVPNAPARVPTAAVAIRRNQNTPGKIYTSSLMEIFKCAGLSIVNITLPIPYRGPISSTYRKLGLIVPTVTMENETLLSILTPQLLCPLITLCSNDAGDILQKYVNKKLLDDKMRVAILNAMYENK